jgi:hypothetical protein
METSNQEPPKTNEAMGVHIVYISKAISEIKSTLKEIQVDAVGRVEYDEHVLWGKDAVKDLDKRVSTLEDDRMLDDNSLGAKIKKALTDKAVTIIVILIVVIILMAISKLGNSDLFELFVK